MLAVIRNSTAMVRQFQEKKLSRQKAGVKLMEERGRSESEPDNPAENEKGLV